MKLVCDHCGASLTAEDGSLRLRCAFCGAERRLGNELVEAGHDYRQGVAEHVLKAEEQALIARAYANLSGGAAAGVPAFDAVSGTRCRVCGAPSAFDVGAMISHCQYCGASLLADDATRSRGLGEAARAHRATRLEALNTSAVSRRGSERSTIFS